MKLSSRLLSPLLAFLTACAAPGGVMAADKTPPPKTPVTEKAPETTTTNAPPLIVQNSDGTFVIQKEPPKDAPKASGGKKGLVIHPQVVVPIASPSPEKK